MNPRHHEPGRGLIVRSGQQIRLHARAVDVDDRRNDADERALAAERRLSEEDQWLSASDQTLNDRSRAQSDRDQDAADYDQVAAELEREGGVGSAQRDQASAARAESAQERVEIDRLREEVAHQREETAHERDRLADKRDRDAKDRRRDRARPLTQGIVKKNAGDPARARRLAGLVNRCARLSETPSFSRPERSRLVELALRPSTPAPREQRQPKREQRARQQTQRRTGFLRGQLSVWRGTSSPAFGGTGLRTHGREPRTAPPFSIGGLGLLAAYAGFVDDAEFFFTAIVGV